MANITRFDTFSDSLEELFRRALRPMKWPSDDGPAEMKLEVEENDKAYTVRAESPGVRKEDIKVEIDGNQVSISAETKRKTEENKGGKVIRSERYYGSWFRSFSLGRDVDQETSSAKYADGVLELTLPKKATGAVRPLAVQ